MKTKNSYFAEANKLIPDAMGILLAIISVGYIFYFWKLLISTPLIQLSDYIQLSILIFIASTMFVAIWSHKRNTEFSRSGVYLENAIQLINRAHEVLSNKNGTPTNDRVSWVTAARLITRAQHIASLISVDAHQKIFEAEHDYQRHIFGDFLKFNGNPLPTAFFCGSDYSISSIGHTVYHPSQGRIGDKWIPPRIIAVIYRFFQYPDGYEDPLDSSVELSKHEIRRLWFSDQKGVCDYITFRKHFRTTGRSVWRVYENLSPSVLMGASDIDSEMNTLSGLDE